MKHLSDADREELQKQISPDDMLIIGKDKFERQVDVLDKKSILDLSVIKKRNKKAIDEFIELLALLEVQRNFNELELRDRINKVDTALPVDYQSEIKYNSDTLMQNTKIKSGKEEITNKLVCIECTNKIIDFIIANKYGGSNMTEIEKIIEKLTVDKDTLKDSTSPNASGMMTAIDTTIERLKDLSAEFLLGSIPTDKRLVESLKQCIKDSGNMVNKVFGPEMNEKFCTIFGAFIDVAMPKIGIHTAMNLAALAIWSIAKKAASDSKSHDYRSLVFKAYIIRFMVDLEVGSEKSVLYMRNILFPLILEFVKNQTIVRMLDNKETVLYK